MGYCAGEIAKFIIKICNGIKAPISNLRLQAMLYFVWVDYYNKMGKQLFSDVFCAWQLGPAVPEVYYEYCVYGGRPINSYPETEIDENDAEIIRSIIEKYQLVSLCELVERTHNPATSWHQIYDSGRGNRRKIPFELIKQKDLLLIN